MLFLLRFACDKHNKEVVCVRTHYPARSTVHLHLEHTRTAHAYEIDVGFS